MQSLALADQHSGIYMCMFLPLVVETMRTCMRTAPFRLSLEAEQAQMRMAPSGNQDEPQRRQGQVYKHSCSWDVLHADAL